MSRLTVLGLGLSLIFFALSMPVQQQEEADPFGLTFTIPEAATQALSTRDPITFSFNAQLDCSTVEAAFSITPDVVGYPTCTHGQIMFVPTEDYLERAEYMVSFTTALRAATGERLREPIELTFFSRGFLRVSEVVPAHGSEHITVDSDFTVVFDRPVIPLSTSIDFDDRPIPIRMEPAVEGTGEWINTFIYRFDPDEFLEPGTEYTLIVDDNISAVDGMIMPQAFTASFTTRHPRLSRIRIRDGTGFKLAPTFGLYFNMYVERDAIEGGFSFRDVTDAYIPSDMPPEERPELTDLVTGDLVSGTFEWDETGLIMFFTPDADLELERSYLIELDTEKITNTPEETLWLYSTRPYPQLVSTTPEDGQATGSYHGFRLHFNTYMNAESINERLTITPDPERFTGYRSNFAYIASFPANGSTEYTVRIESGIEDIYGNTYDEPIELTYSTSPYNPYIHLRVPAGVGFYNAYKQETGLFVRHLNVDRLDMALYTINPVDFAMQMLGVSEDDGRHRDYHLLRNWQVEVTSPQDTAVPTLLSLGDEQICEGRTTSLRVGDMVTIRTDVPIRGVPSPLISASHMTIYPDVDVPITGGPACADEQIWWQVEVVNERVWINEDQATLEFIDRTVESEIAITDADSNALSPGVYRLRVGMEEPQSNYDRYHTMMVMTANLTIKSSLDEMMIWATDVQSGEPLRNQPLTVYNREGIVATGVTDDQGLLLMPLSPIYDLVYENRVAILHTDTHFGIGMTNWANGIDPGMFEIPANFRDTMYTATVYTDRQAYRPGETVYYRGVVRASDDMDYHAPYAFGDVTISTCDGNTCVESIVELTPFGTFSGQFTIADDAPLSGYNAVRAWKTIGDSMLFSASSGYSVAEFRLPEYQVDMRPAEDNYAQGETLQIVVEGTYYSGGPVSNADVSYQIIASPFSFHYMGEESGFNFYYTDPDRDFWSTRAVGNGSADTDSTGSAVLEIQADLAERPESQRFTIEATLADESDQSVSSRNTVNVHAGEFYIGTRTERYLARQGEDTQVDMLLVDWESIGVAEQMVAVSVYQRVWNNVQRQDPVSGLTYWEYEREDVLVDEGTVTTDSLGLAAYTFQPEQGGTYYLVFKTRDSLGNEIINDHYVWVTSTEYVPWQMNNNNRIPLIADRDDYRVGDTAEILIASPFQGDANALITVERAGVMYREVVTMDSNSYVYELPIEARFAPNVFVSVMIVSGVSDTSPVSEFRMGMIQLPVNIEQSRLTVELSPSTDRAQPQDVVTYDVRVTDYTGEPVQAEVGLALTDAAALVIAPPPHLANDWLLNTFFREQGVSVRTSTPLTMNADRVTQDILDAIKGGGGGGGAGLATSFNVREDFVSTPYWNAQVATNSAGEATVDVTLPDNLTTWTLNAHALTSGQDDHNTRFGQGTVDIISTRPVLIRPVTPRFAVIEDELVFAALVNNNSGEDIVVDVWLEADGVTLHDDMLRTVEIPADGRQRVEWPLTVNNVEHIAATFFVATPDGRYTDASRPPLGQGDDRTLPVYRYESPETVGTSGAVFEAGERMEVIALPEGVEVREGELDIHVQTSLASTTLDSLDYLRTFEHYCIEQTVSRFLPNIITYRAMRDLGITDDELRNNLTEALNIALQKLYAEQKVDGGWGWHSAETSHLTTTAYALIGLTEARQSGYFVDEGVIERAQGFLVGRLDMPRLSSTTWELNQQVFVIYALARSGNYQTAHASNLFEVRDQLNLDARAFLGLTLHMINPNDNIRVETILADFSAAALSTATGIHFEETYRDRWNWSSNTRTTALALELFTTVRPDSSLLPGIVRWLITQRERTHWRTTQETAWSVMALTTWMRVSGDFDPNYDYDISFNDASYLTGTASIDNIRETQSLTITVAEMIQSEANTLLFSRGEGAGNLYYTAYLNTVLPVAAIDPLDQGIIVDRQYVRVDDETQTPVDEATVGENLQVRITIVATQPLHYVNIEDPIPAGAEAVNPNLQTSQQIGTRPTYTRVDSQYGWGWWWFSNIEFRDEKVVLSASYLPVGVYEFVYTIRPVLPGEYNVIPTTAQEFYFPEIYGRGKGMTFTINAADE